MNLIPKTFQASIFPISINFQDMEKVVALVKQKTQDFCTASSSKQQFAVGIKIFPFINRVVSLQIVLIRVEKINTQGGELDNQAETEADSEEQETTRGNTSNKKSIFQKGKTHAAPKQGDNPQDGKDPSANIQLGKKNK